VNEIMAYSKRVSLLMGLAAMTAVGTTLPAQANMAEAEGIDAVLAAETVEINFDDSLLAQSAEPGESTIEVTTEALPAADLSIETAAGNAGAQEVGNANLLLPEYSAQPEMVDSSDFLAFDNAGIDVALESSTVEAQPSDFDNTDLAQVTRGRYGSVAPMYLGAGGNIGIGDRDRTGVASFGFTVIGKVSLGPRFSIRPAALITNQSTSFTVPLTYNFNTMEFANFRFQPYVGAGVDIPTGSDIGLLLSAGADVPISRDFTLNAVTNWRVTSGFGLGISLGVGYNFPFIFE
jgi:hypothetical protein